MRIAQFKVTGSFTASSNLFAPNDTESEYEMVDGDKKTDSCTMSLVKNLDFVASTPLDEEGFCLDKSSVTPFSELLITLRKLREKICQFSDPETDVLNIGGEVEVSYSVYINAVDEQNLYSTQKRTLSINSLADLDLLITTIRENFPKYKQLNMFFFGDFAQPCFISLTSAAERCFGGDPSSPEQHSRKLKV